MTTARRRSARLALAIAGSLLALAGSTASSSAAAPAATVPFVFHSGTFGAHLLQDGPELAGARCRYSGDILDRFRIRFPIAYAVDRTSRVDSQRVRWKYRVEGSNTLGVSWSKVVESSAQAATATEETPAPFTSRTFTFDPATLFAFDEYRVVIKIFWLTDGAVTGRAYHEVLYYDEVGHDGIQPSHCALGFT